MKAYLSTYPVVKTYTSKVVQVVAANCDCSALAWDAPTITPVSIGVNIGASPTIPPPAANTGARTGNAAFDACYYPAGVASCPITGSFQAGSVKYDDGSTAGGIALPSWITFSSTGSESQTITINPPDGSYNGVHTLFATFSATHGTGLADYTALRFTVTCTLTSYTMPAVPAEPTFDLSYIIFDPIMTIDLSTLTYTENPTCNYAVTTAITWTGLDNTFMTQDANNPSLITF